MAIVAYQDDTLSHLHGTHETRAQRTNHRFLRAVHHMHTTLNLKLQNVTLNPKPFFFFCIKVISLKSCVRGAQNGSVAEELCVNEAASVPTAERDSGNSSCRQLYSAEDRAGTASLLLLISFLQFLFFSLNVTGIQSFQIDLASEAIDGEFNYYSLR